jgi:hypothetical protein
MAVGAAFLIAASQTNCDRWATFFVISGIGAFLASVYLFGALFLARGLPDMGEERRITRLEREHEALMAYFSRVNALDELIAELGANERDLYRMS